MRSWSRGNGKCADSLHIALAGDVPADGQPSQFWASQRPRTHFVVGNLPLADIHKRKSICLAYDRWLWWKDTTRSLFRVRQADKTSAGATRNTQLARTTRRSNATSAGAGSRRESEIS